MPITISSISSPSYVAADGSSIDVILATKEYGPIPCTLHPNDPILYTYSGQSISNSQLYSMAAAGQFGAVGAYAAPPAPTPTCQLWQLQAVLPVGTWVSVQSAVMALNNPAITAFFQHGTNVIPANSTTLAQLAVAVGVDPATLPALVTQASQVVIP